MPATATAAKKILIIDDDPIIRRTLRSKFETSGYEVHESPDGAKGFETMKAARFDAILLDLKMPERDGLSVLKARNLTLNGHTPLFVLTSVPSDIATEKVRELGVDQILFKGELSPREVVAHVQKELSCN